MHTTVGFKGIFVGYSIAFCGYLTRVHTRVCSKYPDTPEGTTRVHTWAWSKQPGLIPGCPRGYYQSTCLSMIKTTRFDTRIPQRVPRYIPEYDQTTRFGTQVPVKIPRYMPEYTYDLNSQVWYPGTPEGTKVHTRVWSNIQVWYPGTTRVYTWVYTLEVPGYIPEDAYDLNNQVWCPGTYPSTYHSWTEI